MSRTEAIIQEILALTPEERDTVYQELKRRQDQKAQALAFLEKLRARGPRLGVWGSDAQDYINQQRADDRF